jgi:thiamine-phosphate pyrophosphorylase
MPEPGICLLTPAALTRQALGGAFAAALESAAVEVVILTAATQASGATGVAKQLRELAEGHGKVFLVEQDIGLAASLEAEGMLVAETGGIAATRKAIGREAMVGVLAGLSRHRAMEAGEAGADFVGLAPDGATDADMDRLIEHIQWWSELFEVPSMAFGARTPADAARMAEAGADFLALGDPVWEACAMAAALTALSGGAETGR